MKNKTAKIRVSSKSSKRIECEDEGEFENEGNEDIFNNEEMENPTDEESARFLTPARRNTPGISVNDGGEYLF